MNASGFLFDLITLATALFYWIALFCLYVCVQNKSNKYVHGQMAAATCGTPE